MGRAGGRRDGFRARGRERGGAGFKLLVLLAVLSAFAALAWMVLLPFVVTARIRERTGFEAGVARVVANPFNGEFDVRGLVLRNPADFPVRDFVALEQVSGTVRVRSLFSERTEFDAITMEVGAITLVKAENGAINAEAFERAVARRAAGRRAFAVRELRLRVDRLVVVDYSGGRPRSEEQALGKEQVYREITAMEQVFEAAALQPLAPVAEVLLSLVPGEIGASITTAASAGAERLKEAGRKTGEGVKGFFDALEESKKP